MKKQALGRGLSALIDTDPTPATGSTNFSLIPIRNIHPNPNQPRTEFNDEALQELADSIKTNGIITPITLRKIDSDNYQIIAGERRYRASQLAGLDEIPAYIREAEENEVLEMALIENIQREDLNAIEIALSYNSLMQINQLTQEGLAQRIGKKRATIANYLRLLKLPADIQLALKEGTIEMGHARAIAGIDNPEAQLHIFQQIINEKASVRRAEELARIYSEGGNPTDNNETKKQKKSNINSEEVTRLAEALAKKLNTKVNVTYNDKGKGKITIPFSSDENLSQILAIFEKL